MHKLVRACNIIRFFFWSPRFNTVVSISGRIYNIVSGLALCSCLYSVWGMFYFYFHFKGN